MYAEKDQTWTRNRFHSSVIWRAPRSSRAGGAGLRLFPLQAHLVYAAHRGGPPGHHAGRILLDTAEKGLKKRCEILFRDFLALSLFLCDWMCLKSAEEFDSNEQR